MSKTGFSKRNILKQQKAIGMESMRILDEEHDGVTRDEARAIVVASQYGGLKTAETTVQAILKSREDAKAKYAEQQKGNKKGGSKAKDD